MPYCYSKKKMQTISINIVSKYIADTINDLEIEKKKHNTLFKDINKKNDVRYNLLKSMIKLQVEITQLKIFIFKTIFNKSNKLLFLYLEKFNEKLAEMVELANEFAITNNDIEENDYLKYVNIQKKQYDSMNALINDFNYVD